jgi:hypothetical protein
MRQLQTLQLSDSSRYVRFQVLVDNAGSYEALEYDAV